MALVKFKADVYPHVKDDVVELDAKELKRVDEVADRRGIAQAYSEVKVKKEADK